MKTLTGWLYCAVLLLIAGCKSNHLEIFPALSQPQLMNAELSPEQLRADVDAFVAGVIDRHPDISRYTDLAHIHQQARLLKDELTTPMTRQVFYKKIGALSHLFNDGHTFLLWPYQEYQALKQSGARPFPFALDVFPQGVFLKNGYQFNGQSLPKGTRLLSINNVSVETIFTLAQQYVGGETPLLRQHVVADRFPMMVWAVFGFIDTFTLSLDFNGKAQQVTMHSADNWQQLTPTTQHDNEDFIYQRLNSDTGYLKIATFDVSPDWFETFIDNTFQIINEQRIKRLIIDIRENTGGNTDTATYLTRHLTNTPFRMISSLRERLNADNRGLFSYRGKFGDTRVETWDDRIAPVADDHQFSGETYILISPLTYSSAIVFATAAQDNNMAMLVGRETGGYANQTAQGNLFNLPHSELRVYVATRLLIRPSGDLTVSGVKPDIQVTATHHQIESGTDADVQAVLDYAESLHTTR